MAEIINEIPDELELEGEEIEVRDDSPQGEVTKTEPEPVQGEKDRLTRLQRVGSLSDD